MASSEIESPLAHLSDEQIEALAKEFDAIHDEVYESLGDRDRRYIVSMIALHRRLAVLGRTLLFASRLRPMWVLGTAATSAAKILENMEIGHNVLHGQWDWMNDPQIHSSTWDWDTASTAEAWKHSHNYIHHTYTNIRGKDRDLGYEIMRIDPQQKWHPVYLLQPLYNVVLAFLFEWGVAVHDLDFQAIRSGDKPKEQVVKELKGIAGKARTQIVKDYVAWPLVSALVSGGVAVAAESVRATRGRSRARKLIGRVNRRLRRRERTQVAQDVGVAVLRRGARTYQATLGANLVANVIRNVWSYAIIFCGHFPDQTYTFSQEEVEDESRGRWYVRQLVGAANISGSAFFHVASGNLGYQVEHHLYPDMPSSRYAEIAPRVKDICERYELPYNVGPFSQQFGMVQRSIARLAFPGGHPQPKPGPYHAGEDTPASSNGHKAVPEPGPTGPDGSGPEQSDEGVRVQAPPRSG
ncbi:MAG TPA: fatty acid desaturase [Solirubrobacteraceae bacterium]|nr:fatty acid desaturase [Solirubrobacteraceae bacterium]